MPGPHPVPPSVEIARLWRDSAERDGLPPGTDIATKLKWFQVYSHVLMLNVSEQCRIGAACEADRECGIT